MSGIAGICLSNGQPVDRILLEGMAEILGHRGPDGVGIWSEGSVGLVHRMLWTTPESLNEKLPLANRRADLAITADARIDNREDLAAAVDLGGRPLNEIADSELILLAYEKWGERCVERLLGDFAFVVWNARNRQLFCARDHMGVKPFYYHHSNGLFVFGSEIKAILTLPQVPRKLNETRVGDYLLPMLNDKEITFFQGIVRLPPAHTMTVQGGDVRLNEYWALDLQREVRFKSDEEYAEAFRAIFTEAVRCRLRSAHTVGAELSGGLDSSSVTCVARDLLSGSGRGPLPTFSNVFDEVPECDERLYIDAVVAGGGLLPQYVRGDLIGPLVDLDRVFWHQDEAFYGGNLFLEWGLYAAASRSNVRALLTGFDGDTTVSHGFSFLVELARGLRWPSLAIEIKSLSRSFGIPWCRLLWNRVFRPLAPALGLRAWRLVRGRDLDGWRHPAAIRPDFALGIGLRERYFALEGERSGNARTARAEHLLRLRQGIVPFSLEVLDRAAAAFHVELRHPFCDRRLVEYCLALPPEQRLHGGLTRVVMRRAMAALLPDAVRRRGGKSNLAPNFFRALLKFERERLEGVVFDKTSAIWEFMDADATRQAYRQYLSGRPDADVMAVWAAVSLALWLRWAGFDSRPARFPESRQRGGFRAVPEAAKRFGELDVV